MWWSGFWLPLRALFRKNQVERELDDELRFHLEMQIEENIKRGMSPKAARHLALCNFGGIEQTKEECRETRGIRWLDELWQDLRFGMRMLRRGPAFTAVAVITLALGIGATTAIFTVVNSVLLRPLPYPEPERLVYIKGDSWGPFSNNREFIAWKNRSQTLSQIAAYMSSEANFTDGGEAERVTCGSVTSSFFPLLGMEPVMGRSFLPEEDQPGGPPVVILSHARWQRLGSDASVIGRMLAIDGKSYAVIGVLPATARIPDRYKFSYDFWMPLRLSEAEFALVRVIGRLKPGVGVALARSELDTILQSTLRKGVKRHAVLAVWQEEITGGARLSLLIFLGAVGFVLLIACVNVANLFMARAAVREREIVLRRALGAGNPRILRQLLTESILMALFGGVLGLALAFWGSDLLVVFIAGNLPTLDPVTIDHRVLGFNLSVALLTGFAFGLAPAFQAVGIPLNESLKEGGRSVTEGRRHHGLGNGLVICEIALALVLLIGAGLLLKSFLQLRGLDPGFKTDHILRLTINLTPSKYPKPADQARFFQQVLERVSGLAGVQSAGVDDGLDLSGVDGNTVTGCKIEGRPDSFDADWAAVSPDFFRVLGIPLIHGRAFAESDRDGAPSVVIVNESFVRHYFPNENCLGKRMDNWVREHDRLTIVGVVPDVRGYETEKQTRPQLYLPYLQDGHAYMNLLVRTAGDPMNLAAAVRSRIRSVDADQPPYDIMTLEQGLSEYLAPQRINMLLLATFATLALALASIGIYGVISYSVSRRTHEIGVRAALGAQPRDVLRLVLRQGILLVGIGLGIGIAASFALSRVISSLLYGVSATDPLTFAGIALLLSLVAGMACYIPARRATKIDPMDALRRE